MRRKVQVFVIILTAVILGTGCAGMGVLEEIPRDFALVWQTSRGEGVFQGTPEPPCETPAPQETETDKSEAVFLMEEACSFACDSLSEAEQIWYHDMEQILGSFDGQIELSAAGLEMGLTEVNIDRIFQCVLGDHPELFYVDGYSYTKYMRGEELTSIEFSGTYSMDLETALTRREEIAEAAQQILDGIEKGASDYDKVKYVYDTIIRGTDYDLEALDNQNIYSVFIYHLSVCQGYAKATQYLLNKLGVECTLVLGMVETGEGHAWNLVKIDGDYYYVDATWGDVSYQKEDEASRETEESPLIMPEINYDYLNVTTEELLRTHVIGGEVPMPLCVATEANYYVREGAFFNSYNKEQMTELFRKAAASGQRDVTVKCADAACYETVMSALIDGQEIFTFLNSGKNKIAYAQNAKQLSLTFWVTNE